MNAFLVCLPSVLVALSYPVTGVHPPSSIQEKPPLVLEGAHYVRQRLENGETVIILEGDVRWSRGDNRLRCDRAKYYEESNFLYLSREVRLVFADRRVHADSITYISDREYAIAMGNVVLDIADGDVIVRSDSIDYDLGKKEAWAFKRPELILSGRDSGDDHTGEVTILGDHLHMVEENFLAIKGEVAISGDSLVGGADSLNYDMIDDRIVLLGTPWIEIGSYRLVGETLELRVPGRVLRRGISRGNARGEQRNKVEGRDGGKAEGLDDMDIGKDITNWIEADSIFLAFRENRIDSLLALPDARSYYRVSREEGMEENYAAGDEILLTWKDRQLDIVRVRGRGEGVYLKGEGKESVENREGNVEANPDEGEE